MYLGIYGAGGLGREILVLAEQINHEKHLWEDIIFIDDTMDDDRKIKNRKVITFKKVQSEFAKKEIELVIAVGEPFYRKLLRERVYNADFRLVSLIHPSANISDCAIIGAGTIICYNSSVACDVIIEENVLLQPFTTVGHDSNIKGDTVISSFVGISGGCVIGRETYVGMHVPVKEKATIGEQTIVGMGSVVIRDIPDGVIAMGNPARAMKENIDHRVFRNR